MTPIEQYCNQQGLECRLFEHEEKYYVEIKCNANAGAVGMNYFISHHYPDSYEISGQQGYKTFCLGTVFDFIRSYAIKPQDEADLLGKIIGEELKKEIDQQILASIISISKS